MKFSESKEKNVWRGSPNRNDGLCGEGRQPKEILLRETRENTHSLPSNLPLTLLVGLNPEDKRAHECHTYRSASLSTMQGREG